MRAPSDFLYAGSKKGRVRSAGDLGARPSRDRVGLRRGRVVNDLLGGKPALLVHQPASDTTTAFVARFGGKTLAFEAADAEASP